MNTKEKIIDIINRLKKEYPEQKTALHFRSPFDLLVATILSAQATDILVNKVTRDLFTKYTSVKDYADVPLERLQKDVSSINFYKTKAKNIQASAQIIVMNFHAKVPKTMEELTTLPGVARKTANIILSNAYGINAGIAVDTHVKRLSYRLGLTKNEDPVKIERDLMESLPKEDWSNLSHLLISHGRKICQAIKPKHQECVLSDICPSRDI
ncbi:MAG TPA: endonuclease III [Thermodesulfovibrionales bacterium]|jgi:endonuclease-3|nr:endonuclease III [Thermodesulfovibrionales bacterium]